MDRAKAASYHEPLDDESKGVEQSHNNTDDQTSWRGLQWRGLSAPPLQLLNGQTKATEVLFLFKNSFRPFPSAWLACIQQGSLHNLSRKTHLT